MIGLIGPVEIAIRQARRSPAWSAPSYDAPMSRVPLLIAFGMVALARAAAAESCGDPSALRADLEQEASHARYWNLAWRIGFTAGAVGQFAIAASGTVGHDNAQSLWVGGVKSSLGAFTRWILPLQIDPICDTAFHTEEASRLLLWECRDSVASEHQNAIWSQPSLQTCRLA